MFIQLLNKHIPREVRMIKSGHYLVIRTEWKMKNDTGHIVITQCSMIAYDV